jgi:hypothetical protein
VEVVEHRNVIRSSPDQKVVYCNVIELFPYNAHILVHRIHSRLFIVGFYCVVCCCLCRNSSTFPKGCNNPASAVFHNFDLLIGFERLFSAVHIWLDGDCSSKERRSLLCKVAGGKKPASLAALPVLVWRLACGPATLLLDFHQPSPTFPTLLIFHQLSTSFINPADSAPPYNTLLNMSAQGQGQSITFAPACIGTSIVDEEFKLRYFREWLKDESLQFQRKNIEFLIHYYENGGKIPAPGQTMWLLDGKVVDKRPEKVPKGSAMWSEEVCLPLTLTYYYLYSYILRPCAIKSIAIRYWKSLPSDYCNSRKLCKWRSRHSLG